MSEVAFTYMFWGCHFPSCAGNGVRKEEPLLKRQVALVLSVLQAIFAGSCSFRDRLHVLL